ncbi:Hint domain-containing protein [Oceaniglobus trochenteri]|uniref:Hint domain-containing protein n=1 Tax=Oceaniglobus trochenteri TaxID=2763260 RepID=UPI001CFF6FCF|nr:Hint domain-containing protein [Oceaniglobus trochenteri]
MAFISEINMLGGGGANSGEFVEIVLGPDDNPADFVLSAYDENGNLHTTSGLGSGQVRLSSLTGSPDPDNSDFTVYVIPLGIRNAKSDSNEASGVSLTDTSGATNNVLSFYSADSLPPITAQQGAATNAVSDDSLDHTALQNGESYQWDIAGNRTIANKSSGDAVLCVTADARLRTRSGFKRAGDLRVGDLVWTADHDYQPVRWIGKRSVSQQEQDKTPALRPLRIRQDRLGCGTPTRDLLLSAQHRVMLRTALARSRHQTDEVLVAANKLDLLPGIKRHENAGTVEYIHLLFDHHEVIEADGALVESLLLTDYTAPQADAVPITDLGSKPKATRPARPIVEGKQAEELVRLIRRCSQMPVMEADDRPLDATG